MSRPDVAPALPTGHFDATLLGSGCSAGVPQIHHVISGECERCAVAARSLDGEDKNRRSNVSLLVRYAHSDGRVRVVMIDAGKTVRGATMAMFPRLGVRGLDALLLSHDHADAMMGLDDLRELIAFERLEHPESGEHVGYAFPHGPMAVHVWREHFGLVRRGFSYLTDDHDGPDEWVPPADLPEALRARMAGVAIRRRWVAHLHWHIHDTPSACFAIDGLPVRTFPVLHGGDYVCLAFAFGHRGQLVYISDIKRAPAEAVAWLASDRAHPLCEASTGPGAEGVDDRHGGAQPIDLLVLDTLALRDHYSHFSLPEAQEFILQLRPRRAVLIGMTCSIGDHDEVNAQLREWSQSNGVPVELGFDGMSLGAFATAPARCEGDGDAR